MQLFNKILPTKNTSFAQRCDAIVQSGHRKLDKEIHTLKQLEKKNQNLIIISDGKVRWDIGGRSRIDQDMLGYAHKVIRLRKQITKLKNSKAMMTDVNIRIANIFTDSHDTSTMNSIIRDLDSLGQIQPIAKTASLLSAELSAAGVMKKLFEDDSIFEEEYADENEYDIDDDDNNVIEAEVESLLQELLGANMAPERCYLNGYDNLLYL